MRASSVRNLGGAVTLLLAAALIQLGVMQSAQRPIGTVNTEAVASVDR